MSQDEDQPKPAEAAPGHTGESSAKPGTRKRRYRGKKFGRYTLLQRIAHGGMGEIFLARQSGHGGFSKLVAIKRILSHYSDDDDHVRMFFDEAKLQSILNERHIVQIYDMGKVGEHLFICMEYVHGISMRRLIRRLRKREEVIHPAYACELMEQVCRGLSYAHNVSNSQGQKLQIVHRDINPQNLLISFDGELKIIDFGIAKSEMSEVQTESGTLKGKFTYMSPEQGSGLPLDRRSDIFSVGICLYELLTGVNPFKRSNLVLSLAAIQQEEPAPLNIHRSDLAFLEPVLKLSLEKNKENRFQDCADLAEALQNLVRTGKCGSPPQPMNEWMKSLFKEEIEEHLSLLEQMGSTSEIALHSGPAIARTTSSPLVEAAHQNFADDDTNSHQERIPDSKQVSEDEDNSRSDISVSELFKREESDSAISQVAGKRPGTDTTKTGIQMVQQPPMLAPENNAVQMASFVSSIGPGVGAGLFLGALFVLLFWAVRPASEPAPQTVEETTGLVATLDATEDAPQQAIQPPPTQAAEAAQPKTELVSSEEPAPDAAATPNPTQNAAAADAVQAPATAPPASGENESKIRESSPKAVSSSKRPAKSNRKPSSKSASRKGATKNNAASKKPAQQIGKLSMRASGGYKFSGKTFSKKTSGALVIRKSSVKYLRVRGSDKPFQIDLKVREKNNKLFFAIKSSPWSIVQVNDRSHGKSPTTFSISPESTVRVLLKNPKSGSVKLSFKWTLQ